MIKQKDKYLYLCLLFLSFLSIINLYNAKYLNTLYSSYYLKQIIWIILGFTFLLFNKITNIIVNNKYLYLTNILLLIIVLFLGKTINGSKAWLNLGFASFQPSELMKISLPFALNYILSTDIKKCLKLIYGFLLTLLPSILVFLEPDTGAIIFYLLFFIIFLINLKLPYKYYLLLLIFIIVTIFSFIYLYIYKQDLIIKILGNSLYYRIDRLINFQNNYQLNLSKIGIYSSPFFRNGFNNIKLYIPEGHTDFIFAFAISNYGIIMIPLIIITYIILICNLIKNKTNYLRTSFIFMLLFQILINICMNIGLCPIIGINLPFLSYGGSNMIIYYLFLSYIINMDMN